MEKIIAPSLLAADVGNLSAEIRKAKERKCLDWLHFDVMDGVFVPNISFGVPILEGLKKQFRDVFFDVHLMITEPENHIKSFAKAGADLIVFHLEATRNVEQCINLVKFNNKKVGIAIKPSTKAEEVAPYLDMIDMVLCMTVEPGFGGQKLMQEGIDNARYIRDLNKTIDIQLDGGVNLDTAQKCVDSGANIFVAGALFKMDNPEELSSKLRL